MYGVVFVKRHILAVLLCLGMAALLFPAAARAEEPLLAVSEAYRDSVYYQRLCAVPRSGDQRADLVNVALSQVGYHEGDCPEDYGGGNAMGKDNYTEYSSAFYGMNGQWCAMFVSWCARQAGIPRYVLNSAARAASDGAGGSREYFFHIATQKPDSYTPLPGDLVFFTYDGYNSSHVGIVAAVTEAGIRTVEGNSTNAVRVNDYALDSPLILRYGIYSYEALTAEIAPIPTVELVFASDTGEAHGVQPDDGQSAYHFHSLQALAGAAMQIPPNSFCRAGYQLLGYYVRRCDDGRWLSTARRWVEPEDIQAGNARPMLLAEGVSVDWTGVWTEAERLELHCVWKDAGGLTAPDESAAELRPVDGEGWQNPYYDLTERYWYYADVRAASQAGLLPYTWAFEGWRDGTRGEFLQMLYRLLDRPAAEPTAFVDLEADSETGAAVGWAYAAGLVRGVDATHFAPLAPLSREQAAVILHRLFGAAAAPATEELPAFADAEAVSPWAADAVGWATARGLLRGMPADGGLYLQPQRAMTRPEAVALLRRAAALLEEAPVDIT